MCADRVPINYGVVQTGTTFCFFYGNIYIIQHLINTIQYEIPRPLLLFFFQLKSCLLNHDCILIRHLTCSTKNNPTSMASAKKSTTKTTLIYTIKHFSAASKGNVTSPDFSKGKNRISTKTWEGSKTHNLLESLEMHRQHTSHTGTSSVPTD